jgi:antitoxin component YwqK of YwqJK toxin-antitoxin module
MRRIQLVISGLILALIVEESPFAKSGQLSYDTRQNGSTKSVDTIVLEKNTGYSEVLYNSQGSHRLSISSDTIYNTQDSMRFNGVLVQQIDLDGAVWTNLQFQDSYPNYSSYSITYCQFREGVAQECTSNLFCFQKTLSDSSNSNNNGYPVVEYKNGPVWKCEERHSALRTTDDETTYRYFKSGKLAGVERVYVKNDVEIHEILAYFENGDTATSGQYMNGEMVGEWKVSYDIDSTSVQMVQIWDNGNLVSIKSENVIFLGQKNKIISKEEYFEIIRMQDYRDWMVFPIPAHYWQSSGGYTFVMYSSIFGFDPHDEKHIKKILKQQKRAKN